MAKSMHNLPAVAMLLALLGGCSNEQAYNAVRDNRTDDCPYRPPSEREECLRRYEKTYEEYKREREELLKEGE